MATILGLFGVVDFAEAGRITLEEFRIRKRGYNMYQLEREKELYMQAYLNRMIKATDDQGKEYVYKKFSDFYDEVKRKSEVLGKTFSQPVDNNLLDIARRMQKYDQEGGVY